MNGRIISNQKNGFTIVGNAIIYDERLSLKAKGIYAIIKAELQKAMYIDGYTVYKGHIQTLARDGRDGFNTGWKELKDRGYLKTIKRREEETQKYYYEYIIYDEPQEAENIENQTNEPHTEFPYTEFPHTANPYLNNNRKKKKRNNKNTINQSEKERKTETEEKEKEKEKKIDTIERKTTYNYENVKQVVESSIQYDSLKEVYNELAEDIRDIIIDTICSNANTIRIAQENKQIELVKSQFLKLNYWNVSDVIEKIKNSIDPIGNIKSYVLTLLYNSRLYMNAEDTNNVNQAMYEY